jgi:hypothetical protein
MPAYCGFHSVERVLLRENVNTRRLAEPNYLSGLLAEHAKLTALKDWQVTALHPIDGEPITAAMPSRPGLLLGLPLTAAREAQNRFCRLGLLPRRLELGSVAMLGALTRYMRDGAYAHAVVACEIGRTETRIYFLAKDGVHTPAILPHGLLSIEETAMKELGVPDVATARARLAAPTDEIRAHARRLVRMLTRHLKPAPLAWLEEALSAAVDLDFLVPDLNAWLPRSGVQLAPDAAPPSRSWFQALSLVAQLAPPAAHEAKA